MEQKYSFGLELKCLTHQFKRQLEFNISSIIEDQTVCSSSILIGYIVHNKNKPVYQKDLEKNFNITKGTASKALSILETKGYIERINMQEDARFKKIVPTSKAIELSNQIEDVIVNVENSVIEGFSEKEIEQLSEYLKRISKNLGYAKEM